MYIIAILAILALFITYPAAAGIVLSLFTLSLAISFFKGMFFGMGDQ